MHLPCIGLRRTVFVSVSGYGVLGALHCPLAERREKENKQFQNWTNKITCPLLCPCEIQNSLPSCRADQKLSQDGTRRTEKCFDLLVVENSMFI